MNQRLAPSQNPATGVDVNGRFYAAPKRPTVVVCVDGFDPAYLEHGIANGTLPTMKSFKEHGFVAIADCSMPSTTNTNNTSIVTGVPPVVHGINGNYYLDAETGKEIMVTDAKRLRCGTILGALSRAGVKTAVVTAKDKLLKVLAYEMKGINFSSEYAGKANLKENGIDNVEKLVGRTTPDQYSADLSQFVFDAGVKLLSTEHSQLMYLSTSDYVQHKHAPGEPEADAYHQAVDKAIASLISLGATVAITADHGMNDKSAKDGTPNVVYLEDELNSRFGDGSVRVICPIADPFVRHHGALGSFVRVHLRKPGDVHAMIAFAKTLPGIELVLDKQQVCRQFELPIDREGDFAVFSDRNTVVGARREDHNLSQLAGHRLRSHGGLGEQKVPFLISRPISEQYKEKAKAGPLHNYDIFDFALNGVVD
ncbi:phosphonoacetate hydrolase [Bradyrhizobium neotropicale]|uniref:phosphonoacetate hydrolase n=1 Tax=Bradyrhizobium neotropicale TaxID=1497615 RepID=UPI001AD7C174|nr:phosphonoacetate hydrolase [Bradyrhizobium neotropicale]MBO4227201.1 phosphonoacetate hydrolase [Bradyrhizobium neotropicale]